MTGSVPVSQMLPGVHRVRKRRADGGVTEFWYAYRGGPQILRASAASDALLAREVAKGVAAAVTAYEGERKPTGDQKFVYGLITRYLAEMAENGGLAERTKADRRKFLDRARDELGEMEIRALESRRARKTLIDWRDQYKDKPKTADELLGAISTVLQWAADRGEISANPVKDFPRLYKANRAEVIWEPEHLATLFAHADLEFEHAVRFAALTAIRESDLVDVPWTAVGEHAIVWQTRKSNRKRTIVVPITPPLRALLSEIPRRATTILTSSRGRPWTASGLAAALRRCRIAAKAQAEKIHGKAAKSGIEELRLHDLRGTAATNFLLAGLEMPDVALILGWKPDRVREIAARYITGEAMGLAMVKRLGRNAPKTNAVNRPVNRGSRQGA